MIQAHIEFSEDKRISHVRNIFERRARTFNSANFLHREVAKSIISRLESIKLCPKYILDAGCGLGMDLRELQLRYVNSNITGVDLSRCMLEKQDMPDILGSKPSIVQADFGRLPFKDHNFDMVWSNLALHWHPQPHLVLLEWYRVLNSGGLLMCSLFGKDTLKEIRAAWKTAEERLQLRTCERVIPFMDMHDFGDMLLKSGFSRAVVDMEKIVVTYRNIVSLLTDMRRLGSYVKMKKSNGVSYTAAGLSSRLVHSAFMQTLNERFQCNENSFPLTFEITYGYAWRDSSKMEYDVHDIVHRTNQKLA